MKEDMNFMRQVLITIEEESDGINFYDIREKMTSKVYNKEFCYAQLEIMKNNDLFSKVDYCLDYGFQVKNLSEKGYQLLNEIRNEKSFKKYIKLLKKNKHSETIANLFILFCRGVGAGIAEYRNYKK